MTQRLSLGRIVGCLRLAALACALLFALPGAAQDAPNLDEETLTGDWGGLRTQLGRKGIVWEIGYIADFLTNVSGGASRGAGGMGHLDAKLAIDMGKAAGWTGNRIILHAIWDHGDKLNSRRVGSFMGVDNIEVATNTAKIFQAWTEQRFLGGTVAVLGGLYAVDAEFNINEASEVFLHPSFGASAELAQTGRNGPSIFPTTSVGVRVRLQPTPAFYAQAALLDGVPGDPNNQRGTHVRFRSGDGTLLIAEAGFSPSRSEQEMLAERRRRVPPPPDIKRFEVRPRPVSKIAAGFWRYSGRFDDLIDVDAAGTPLPRRSEGLYVLAEETLYQEPRDDQQGLSAFGSFGVANSDSNPVASTLVAGLRYVGMFPGRGADELGLGFVRARAGSKFHAARAATGIPTANAETAIELTYRAQVNGWLAVQPTLQWISNPGFAPAPDHAWVFGARVEIAF